MHAYIWYASILWGLRHNLLWHQIPNFAQNSYCYIQCQVLFIYFRFFWLNTYWLGNCVDNCFIAYYYNQMTQVETVGATMVPISWTEMQCPLTGQIEKRKVAKASWYLRFPWRAISFDKYQVFNCFEKFLLWLYTVTWLMNEVLILVTVKGRTVKGWVVLVSLMFGLRETWHIFEKSPVI